MRIQHNIMAMNAYRNYNINTKAISCNLEKLSSSYKINRAGDDAAGLAISEKMRAQITGLDAAQKNVKDCISLVKTAEGAMQEIQDMLNRMDYLATQSANGTYDNEVDCFNLQKEVKQLKSEIDRIADSANFNGIKLLDGSQETGATEAVESTPVWDDAIELDIGNKDQAHALATATVGHALRKDGNDLTPPEFTVDLTNVKFTASDAGGFNVTIGSTKIAITKKGTNALAKDDVLEGTDLADAIVAAVNAYETTVKGTKTTGGDSDELNGVVVGGLVYKAETDGNNVKFVLQDKDKNNAEINDQTPAAGSIPRANVLFADADAGKKGDFTGLDAGGHANTKITAGVAEKPSELAHATFSLANQIKDGTKLTIGKETYVFKIGADSTVKNGDGETLIDMSDVSADDANLVDKAIAKLTSENNSWFRLESGASGLLTAVEKVGDDSKPVYKGEGDITTSEGLKSNFKISQMSMTEAKAASDGNPNKGITLQIGDTSDKFNQLKISIGDMYVKSLGTGDYNGKPLPCTIEGIDISTQDGAHEAIDVIKKAINDVSSVRGDLGAYQNRLEHTGNNLSVMAENIQDAESTIRNTDVANEMMSYVKNNILVQSAQAMLAQANQVPQGVLQLLG